MVVGLLSLQGILICSRNRSCWPRRLTSCLNKWARLRTAKWDFQSETEQFPHPSSIPGQRTQIPQVAQHGQKRERERKPQNKTKKEILQLKNARTEMKISLDSFNSIFDQAEEISEPKDSTMKTVKTYEQKEKRFKGFPSWFSD